MIPSKPRIFSWYLTKYISQDVVFGFVSGTTLFLLILVMFQAIRLSEFVVIHQVALKDVGMLSLFVMLSLLPIAVPIAFLFSVLLGISRANSEGEILALEANGISPAQIFAPLGVFSIVVTGLCLYTSLYTVPQGNRAFELLYTKLGSERVMAALKPGVFLEGFYGMVLFAEQIIPLKNEMKRVFIYDEREDTHPLAITAEAGILRIVPEKGSLTLRLTDGAIHVDQAEGGALQQKIEFEVYDINLEVGNRSGAWRAYSPQSFNYDQLKERIVETEPDPPLQRTLKAELHQRFSLSFSCMVFALLGFVIGVRNQRGARSTAIVLCIGVGIVYWLIYLGGKALAIAGWLDPAFAMWAPNLIFAALAVLGYRRHLHP